MRNYKTEGIVIRRRNYAETDRILTIFTKESGKIRTKAVGVRRINSRRSAHVELLNYSAFSLYRGRGMPLVLEAQTIENFAEVKNDLYKTGLAYHICELVDGLCAENQENRASFFLLKNTLAKLTHSINVASLIHEFEVELLTILGFWPRARIAQSINTEYFIENILERKLKSKQIIPRLV